MIVSHGVEDDPRFSLRSPEFQIRFDGPRHDRFFDHRHHPLMPVALAEPFKLIVITDLVGVLLFRQVFTYLEEGLKAVFPQKEAVDRFGVVCPQGQGRVDPADSQFTGKAVSHGTNIAYT
jgi:hypothetical protein